MTLERMSSRLPTSGQAMRQAIERAQTGELDAARVWLDIARELRLGEAGHMVSPLPRGEVRVTHLGDDTLLPVCEAVTEDDPGGCLVSFNRGDVTCVPCLRVPAGAAGEAATQQFDRIRVPVPEPGYRAAETIVMEAASDEFPLPPCAYCGHDLVWITPGPGPADAEDYGRQRAPYWAHRLTQQAVCHVPAEDQTHTFATPSVDARG